MAVVTVETQPGRKFATTVTTSDQTLIADEPLSDGGDGLGPSPYELLLAALGSCTTMTLELYARRKGWPLEGVLVNLRFDRIHEQDCESVETVTKRTDRITREFTLSGPLTDDQKKRLLEIAAKCPVHRTITENPRIVDSLSEELIATS